MGGDSMRKKCVLTACDRSQAAVPESCTRRCNGPPRGQAHESLEPGLSPLTHWGLGAVLHPPPPCSVSVSASPSRCHFTEDISEFVVVTPAFLQKGVEELCCFHLPPAHSRLVMREDWDRSRSLWFYW